MIALQHARARRHRGRPARPGRGDARSAEREILRLVDKYGIDTVLTAFDEVQDYVERLTRQRVAELPDGTWETEDYIDYDPDRGEGLVPIKVKLTIEGDQIHYDLTGLAPGGRHVPQRRLRRAPSRAWSPARRPSSPTCR